MTIHITTKDLTALLKIAKTNDSRYYVNCVCFTATQASATYAVTLIRIPCAMETREDGESILVKTEYLKKQLAVTKALGSATVILEPTEEDIMPGKYPPTDAAFPSSPTPFARYNLDQLLQVLTALKSASTKNAVVILASDNGDFDGRPLHLSLDQYTTPQALIMPGKGEAR